MLLYFGGDGKKVNRCVFSVRRLSVCTFNNVINCNAQKDGEGTLYKNNS